MIGIDMVFLLIVVIGFGLYFWFLKIFLKVCG